MKYHNFRLYSINQQITIYNQRHAYALYARNLCSRDALLYTRYPIVARRAWPAECVARAKVSCIQDALNLKAFQARRATIGYLVYKHMLNLYAQNNNSFLASCKHSGVACGLLGFTTFHIWSFKSRILQTFTLF